MGAINKHWINIYFCWQIHYFNIFIYLPKREKAFTFLFIQLKKKLKFAEDDTTTTTVKKDFYSRRGILQLFLNFYCVAAEQESANYKSRRAAPNNKSLATERNKNVCVRVQSVESERVSVWLEHALCVLKCSQPQLNVCVCVWLCRVIFAFAAFFVYRITNWILPFAIVVFSPLASAAAL